MADRNRIRTRRAVGGRRGSLVLVDAREANPAPSLPDGSDTPRSGAIALAANGIERAGAAAGLSEFCCSRARAPRSRGRLAIIGGSRSGPARRRLRGFPQSPANELRPSTTANLARIDAAPESAGFRAAYISGQVLLITSYPDRFSPGA
jgi:hypothetical protein